MTGLSKAVRSHRATVELSNLLTSLHQEEHIHGCVCFWRSFKSCCATVRKAVQLSVVPRGHWMPPPGHAHFRLIMGLACLRSSGKHAQSYVWSWACAVMRGTVEEAVEVCERVLARTNVASHSLAPLDAQVEGLQEEVQAELMASGLVVSLSIREKTTLSTPLKLGCSDGLHPPLPSSPPQQPSAPSPPCCHQHPQRRQICCAVCNVDFVLDTHP